ncbi:hypothetical protein Hypma_003304 [Hypsizygus marmoreus]|uniref:Tryprostatin B 6-hydroxylase n=1 Tax=Hypsizygus marmoreus TaxID=39966 RepID=A0A369K2I1_HYPMA|nr:hypothetical protein Hypma_003304 [Hypsizygus marmoreus]
MIPPLPIVVLALLSHRQFNKVEPRPLPFIASLIFGTLSTASIMILFNEASLLQALRFSCLSTVVYLAFLSASVSIYRLSPWHPLARFPGPRPAAITKWWMVHRILFKGGRHTYFEKLHNEYGPWVRVGPNEVSVNLPNAMRSIYKLDRGSFYTGTPAKADSLITVMDRGIHSRRRQAWTQAVTGDAMYTYIPSALNRVKQLVNILRRESSTGQPVNLDNWINLFFMDLMGDMGFSGGFETMNDGEDKEGWLHTLGLGVIFVSATGQVPWLRSLLQMLPQRGPIETFHTFTENKIKEVKARATPEIRRDILGTLLDSNSGAELTKDEAAADATLIVVGATDTSVQTVLTFFRYICVDIATRDRLQKELDSVFLNDAEDVDVPALMRLPYLDACVQEALRIMAPGPFGPPRSSGESGTVIEGTWIPPNTTLHMPVYAMQRDSANFGLGDQYLPERWLDSTDERKDKSIESQPFNRDAFVPFSAGYSSCVGKHLALQNIKILLAHIMHEFDVKPVPHFDPAKFDASYKEYGLWTHDPLNLLFSCRFGVCGESS